MKYDDFLETKKIKSVTYGHEVCIESFDKAFDFQAAIIQWALKKGRAGVFMDTGLGKTIVELYWSKEVIKHTVMPVIIFAPLCVAKQIVEMGKKFGIKVNYCRSQNGIKNEEVNVSNYEMFDKFDMTLFGGIALDESSILKGQDGKTRKKLIEECKYIPYKLSSSATPSPNDYMEFGNQVEFLGIMKMQEMLATFFTHDSSDTSKWVLKGHGRVKFWEWMATWAVCIKSPSDIGFDDSRYLLPELKIHTHLVEGTATKGFFSDVASTLNERIKARKSSVDKRVVACADLVNGIDEQWIIWCNLNEESEKLSKAVHNSKDIKGSDSIDYKEQVIEQFNTGKLPVLISKSSITGFGMNWQHCNHTAFVGLSDSWESYYQAIRRFYRFGQTKIVNVHLFLSESEIAVLKNLKEKEYRHEEYSKQMISHMRDFMKREITKTKIEKDDYNRRKVETKNYEVHLSDCVDLAKELKTESIDYTIFSPPFSSLYTYSNSDRDMGNSRTTEEFYMHFRFLVKELLRITSCGRLLSFHCMNLPSSKVNDGVIGLKDFRGELIKMFVDSGWIYHSEVCIWKDPVTAMQRTKALGLLHKTIRKDSSMARQGIPDYLVTMRKPGENTKPIPHTHEEFPVELWQRYASPIWMDINQTNVLQYRESRDNDDEKHICPLQLEVIERAIELWTAKDDLVFSPFMGIGSEGYVALKKGRRFIGSELKESYFNTAVKNLNRASSIERRKLFIEE